MDILASAYLPIERYFRNEFDLFATFLPIERYFRNEFDLFATFFKNLTLKLYRGNLLIYAARFIGSQIRNYAQLNCL